MTRQQDAERRLVEAIGPCSDEGARQARYWARTFAEAIAADPSLLDALAPPAAASPGTKADLTARAIGQPPSQAS